MALQQTREFSGPVLSVRPNGLNRLPVHRPPAVMAPVLVNEWGAGDCLGRERILCVRKCPQVNKRESLPKRFVGRLDVGARRDLT